MFKRNFSQSKFWWKWKCVDFWPIELTTAKKINEISWAKQLNSQVFDANIGTWRPKIHIWRSIFVGLSFIATAFFEDEIERRRKRKKCTSKQPELASTSMEWIQQNSSRISCSQMRCILILTKLMSSCKTTASTLIIINVRALAYDDKKWWLKRLRRPLLFISNWIWVRRFSHSYSFVSLQRPLPPCLAHRYITLGTGACIGNARNIENLMYVWWCRWCCCIEQWQRKWKPYWTYTREHTRSQHLNGLDVHDQAH